MCFITQRRKELEATVLLAVLINGNLLELDHEFIDFLYANNPSLAKKSEPACSFTGRSSSFIFLSVTTVGNLDVIYIRIVCLFFVLVDDKMMVLQRGCNIGENQGD